MSTSSTDGELIRNIHEAYHDQIGFHDALLDVEQRLAEYRRVVKGYRDKTDELKGYLDAVVAMDDADNGAGSYAVAERYVSALNLYRTYG